MLNVIAAVVMINSHIVLYAIEIHSQFKDLNVKRDPALFAVLFSTLTFLRVIIPLHLINRQCVDAARCVAAGDAALDANAMASRDFTRTS